MSNNKKLKQRYISVSEFKSKALGIFNELEKDAGTVVVTKRGKPIATVLPFQAEKIVAAPGTLKHFLIDCDDVMDPVAVSDWKSLL